MSWEVTGIFENIGVVQEGMQTIAVPHTLVDRPDARELEVSRGEIRFEHVTFTYGRADGRRVLDDLNLVVRPGERVGLVGRSGAGKSTLVNLLLRFYELEQGSIRIDGQDIRHVDAGEPARGDRHGDAGHVAAAPLDRRQHPLRPAGRDARPRSRPRRARRRRTSSSSTCRTGRTAPATTRTSASAASSSRAASASASPSRAWC